jgi:hypothetical protein
MAYHVPPGDQWLKVKKSAAWAVKREAEGNWGRGLSDDYKIYVDAGRPATLNNGGGALTDCATLQEAVLAWQRLAPEQKIRATIKVIGGPVYKAYEIEWLDYGPKPA